MLSPRSLALYPTLICLLHQRLEITIEDPNGVCKDDLYCLQKVSVFLCLVTNAFMMAVFRHRRM